MTATKVYENRMSRVLGYYEDDKPVTVEAFQELFLEVRKLRRANRALKKKLEQYEELMDDDTCRFE